MKYALILLLVGSFLSCSKEPDMSLPTCDWVTAQFDGERLRYTITSESPFVDVCVTYTTRVACHRIMAHYYGCISMEAHFGMYITFEDNGVMCQYSVE